MGMFDNIKKKAAEKGKAEANKQAQGRLLGFVKIRYEGGFDEQKRVPARLCFFENRVEYSQFNQVVKGL